MVDPRAESDEELDREGPTEPNVALAWRILTSARTLFALSAALALIFLLSAALPQRPTPDEMVRVLPFASAEAASGLGLNDVLISWPVLLIILLMALNGSGILLARLLDRRPTPVRPGRRKEGAVLVLFGVLALLVGLVVGRASGVDGRFRLVPGSGDAATSTVREGDLYLPRVLPYDLRCDNPDPQDPHRHFACRLASVGGLEPLALTLLPGSTTSAGDLALRPLSERPSPFASIEPYDLVLHRAGGRSAPAIERLRLQPARTVQLEASGERLTAFPGPDGPLLVVEPPDAPPTLFAAPGMLPLTRGRQPAAGDLSVIEVIAPSAVIVEATTAPETPLVLGGVLLCVLGLGLIAWSEARP